ncbi:MAG: helix-turn-helix transcriptional regulator [Lysobacteraceae bacterium]
MAERRKTSVYGRRLREAREARGISQRDLGIEVGLDEFTASPRINRYENGVHQPNLALQIVLAKALGKPLPFFYAEEDELAQLIADYGQQRSSGLAKARTQKKR